LRPRSGEQGDDRGEERKRKAGGEEAAAGFHGGSWIGFVGFGTPGFQSPGIEFETLHGKAVAPGGSRAMPAIPSVGDNRKLSLGFRGFGLGLPTDRGIIGRPPGSGLAMIFASQTT
jgi:hypothetical protein